jgi:hypothetical protein
MIIVKLFFFGCLLAVLGAAGAVFKNRQRLFGADPNLPSDVSSSRVYNQTQIYLVLAVLAHVLLMMLFIL